jgi:geranylgeranylglycerol-phosphate geranylgeranyltransferase
MGVSIGTKIRACADLVRMDLALGAGFFLVAGEILATGGLPPLDQVLLGFSTLFFISGSANISNDYFDRDVDRINLPSRPLPSGRISVRELWVLFFLFAAAGLVAAALLSPLVLALVAALWVLSILYNMKLKEYGIFGNLIVATCLGMIFIVAGIIAGNVNGVVLTFAALAFFFDLGEEIAGGALDMKGDMARSSHSIAKRYGRDAAMKAAGFMYVIFFLLTLVPFLAGWLSYDYLLLVAVMDLFMIRCAMALVRSHDTETGRVQGRRLYLAWGIFVIVFAITRIF